MAVLRNGRPLKWPLSIMTVIQKKLQSDLFQIGGS